MLYDLMERTAEAVATGEPLMISQLLRQTRRIFPLQSGLG